MNKEEFNNNVKVGSILNTSHGYDMTINSFCKVLEIGKTLKCIMIGATITGDKSVKPNLNYTYGKPFRIRITESKRDGYIFLVGSYSFIENRLEAKIRGLWFLTEENKEHYENHDD